jgi:hypothetical protein
MKQPFVVIWEELKKDPYWGGHYYHWEVYPCDTKEEALQVYNTQIKTEKELPGIFRNITLTEVVSLENMK